MNTRSDLDAGTVDFSDITTGERLAPVHPGEVLADALQGRGILPSALAAAMDVPVNRITAIMRGERSITAETAPQMGIAIRTSAELWLVLQDAFDLDLARASGVAAKVRELADA